MTDPRCADFREAAPEVALGIASVEDRARLIDHVAQCAECRAHLGALSAVADEMLHFAPCAEPPAGFESAVLARLADPVRTGVAETARAPRRARVPRWRTLAAAAALIAAAAVSGGVVWQAGSDDRELAAQVRAALATANGEYFTTAAFRNLAGEQRGAVFAYQGDPAWVLCTVDQPLAPGIYVVQIETRAGTIRELGTGRYEGRRAWGLEMPVALRDLALVRIVDQSGRVVLSANL